MFEPATVRGHENRVFWLPMRKRGEIYLSSSGDRLRALHANPEFAAARDRRARERLQARREEMQRLSNAARRGYDVPPELEADWKALKKKRAFSNREIGEMLGLKRWRRKPRRRKKHGKKGQ